MKDFKIEKYIRGHEKDICDLIKKVFDEFVAIDYSEEGNRFFYDWISPEKIAARQEKQNNLWVATVDNIITGMIEIRDNSYISLLFVDKKYQGRGIAKTLFDLAVIECIKRDPGLRKFFVHASPFSIPVYEKMGFKAISSLKEENGIKYLPMEMMITRNTMNIRFEPMSAIHGSEVMEIFNYYIENGFSAYPDKALPTEFFKKLLDMTMDYPAYTIFADDKVAGFCFIRAYNPFSTFRECAEISYFIHKDFTGKGIGEAALDMLITGAKQKGIKTILASISSENTQSISFHSKHGFRECGRFEKVLKKKGKLMDVVWMQKDI